MNQWEKNKFQIPVKSAAQLAFLKSMEGKRNEATEEIESRPGALSSTGQWNPGVVTAQEAFFARTMNPTEQSQPTFFQEGGTRDVVGNLWEAANRDLITEEMVSKLPSAIQPFIRIGADLTDPISMGIIIASVVAAPIGQALLLRAASRAAASGSIKLAKILRLSSDFVAPLSKGSAASRTAVEAGAAYGANAAIYGAGEHVQDLPTPVRIGASLVAGLAGAGAGIGISAGIRSSLGLGIKSTRNKKPWEMTRDEFVEEYEDIALRTTIAEKTPDRQMSPEEIKEFNEKGWEAFSRSRGYSEKEIEDFRRFTELSTDKMPEEYSSPYDMHRDHIAAALRRGEKIPDNVMDAYPGLEMLRKAEPVNAEPPPNKQSASPGSMDSELLESIMNDLRTRTSRYEDLTEADQAIMQDHYISMRTDQDYKNKYAASHPDVEGQESPEAILFIIQEFHGADLDDRLLRASREQAGASNESPVDQSDINAERESPQRTDEDIKLEKAFTNKMRSPWKMTANEYAEQVKLVPRIMRGEMLGPSVKQHMKRVSNLIRVNAGVDAGAKNGESVTNTILDHYKRKYKLGEITIERHSSNGMNPTETGGVTFAQLDTRFDSEGTITSQILHVNTDYEDMGSFPIILRHEIEHAVDVSLGKFEGKEYTADPIIPGAGYYIHYNTEGHHRRWELFESGYAHRAMVKQAIKDGRDVPQHVRNEFDNFNAEGGVNYNRTADNRPQSPVPDLAGQDPPTLGFPESPPLTGWLPPKNLLEAKNQLRILVPLLDNSINNRKTLTPGSLNASNNASDIKKLTAWKSALDNYVGAQNAQEATPPVRETIPEPVAPEAPVEAVRSPATVEPPATPEVIDRPEPPSTPEVIDRPEPPVEAEVRATPKAALSRINDLINDYGTDAPMDMKSIEEFRVVLKGLDGDEFDVDIIDDLDQYLLDMEVNINDTELASPDMNDSYWSEFKIRAQALASNDSITLSSKGDNSSDPLAFFNKEDPNLEDDLKDIVQGIKTELGNEQLEVIGRYTKIATRILKLEVSLQEKSGAQYLDLDNLSAKDLKTFDGYTDAQMRLFGDWASVKVEAKGLGVSDDELSEIMWNIRMGHPFKTGKPLTIEFATPSDNRLDASLGVGRYYTARLIDQDPNISREPEIEIPDSWEELPGLGEGPITFNNPLVLTQEQAENMIKRFKTQRNLEGSLRGSEEMTKNLRGLKHDGIVVPGLKENDEAWIIVDLDPGKPKENPLLSRTDNDNIRDLRNENRSTTLSSVGKSTHRIIDSPVINPIGEVLPEYEATLNKFIGMLRTGIRKGRQQLKQERDAEDKIRSAKIAEITERNRKAGTFDQLHREVRAAQRGKRATPELSTLERLTTQETKVLVRQVFNTLGTKRGMTAVNIQEAFWNLTYGILPQPAELKVMEEVFGSEFAKSILDLRSDRQKLGEFMMEVWNLPRAMLATFDDSMVLRQGLFLIPEGKPAIRAFRAHIKAIKKAGSDEVNAAIKEHEWYADSVENGVEYTGLSLSGGLSGREEMYMGASVLSHLTRMKPSNDTLRNVINPLQKLITPLAKGMEISERVASAYLNKLRLESYAAQARELTRIHASADAFKDLATNVNILSGRANLGRAQSIAPLLNNIFFSARNNVARAQAPFMILKQIPKLDTAEGRQLAKMLARDVYGMWAGIAGMIGLAAASGMAVVELNPKSSDFGKLQVGTTRIDPWGGHQQMAVLIARIISGERKATTTGQMTPAREVDTLMRFIESKFHPALGMALSVKQGTTYIGDDLTLQEFARGWLPLFAQDLNDIVEHTTGLETAAIGTAAFFGVSAYNIPGIPGVMRQEMDKFTQEYNELPSDTLELKRGQLSRQQYRKRNPTAEAALFISGQVVSLSSVAAIRETRRMVLEAGVSIDNIRGVSMRKERHEEALAVGKRLTRTNVDRLILMMNREAQQITANRDTVQDAA